MRNIIQSFKSQVRTQATPSWPWWPLESHFWTCPKHMSPCNDDLSLSALRWNGLEKSSECQGWYWSQTRNYSRSSWNFWVFNTKVQHYLNRRIIQYQVMIFQVQPAVLEFNHRKPSSEIALQENRERAQQMVLPIEPHYRIQHDITYAECSRCIYGAGFLFDWHKLQTPHNWEQTPHHSTSYVELMLQFIFTTFAYPPLLWGFGQKRNVKNAGV